MYASVESIWPFESTLKPESLGTTAAEASPTRVAMIVDKRNIIIKKVVCCAEEKGGNER